MYRISAIIQYLFIGCGYVYNLINLNSIFKMLIFQFQDLKWRGLEELNVFKRPKAVVVVSVSSVPHGGLQLSYKSKYSTVEVSTTLSVLLGAIKDRN